MPEYPVIVLPESIQSALNASPPEPPQPIFPKQPTLKLTPKPQRPLPFNKPIPRPISMPVIASVGGVAILLAVLLPSIGIAIGSVATIVAIAIQLSYPRRLEQHRRDKEEREHEIRQHPYQERNWEHTVDEARKEYAQAIEKWEAEVVSIKAKHRQHLDLLNSTALLNQYRHSLVRQVLERTASYDGTDSSAPKDWAEYLETCSFGSKLKRYFPGKVHDSLLVGYRTPDFAYIDSRIGLHIDIEIDEPYTPRQYPEEKPLILTHYIGADDDRDEFFKDRGWIVLRFSEQQVIQNPDSCCKEVAKVIYELTKEASIMEPFVNTPDLIRERCWTKEDAIQMANKQARLLYSKSKYTLLDVI